MSTLVRVAKESDEAPIMGLLRLMHAEEGADPINEGKVTSVLRRLLTQDDGIVGIIRGDIGIEATIGIDIYAPWNTSACYLDILWLYTHADYRLPRNGKPSHPISLIDFAKWYSGQIDRPLRVLSLCTENTIHKVQFMRRRITEAGVLFIHRGETEPEQKIWNMTPRHLRLDRLEKRRAKAARA